MKIWAVANQKGGVGKTTTSVTLGGLLSERRNRVLLVDLDPHGSMTAYFGLHPDQITGGVYRLFERGSTVDRAEVLGLVHPTDFDGLSLLPASAGLVTLDRQLGSRDGMGLVMTRALAQLETDFDFVLMDCSPALGILMVNALAAADRLIVPVQTEHLALKGLERMLHTLEMVTRARKQALDYIIVPTMFDRRTHAAHDSLRGLTDHYPGRLWQQVVPVDTQFREASRKGAPLSLMLKHSSGALAYAALLETLLENDELHDERKVAT